MEIFLTASEASGDKLGAVLMVALKTNNPEIKFSGVGGHAMEAQGLVSQFPMSDLAAFGFADVIRRFSLLRQRIHETADTIVAKRPSAVVLIDSFGFSFQVAKRVRAKAPDIPIIKYVAPQVWVWREGRAKAMRPYFDHTLALFPFEPEVHRNLNGPPCTYVGHPALEEISLMRPSEKEAIRRDQSPPIVVVMPGSRRSELRSLMKTFGEALTLIEKACGKFELVLPTLPGLESVVREAAADWTVTPKIVVTEDEKFKAMRQARVAIAASGTATLELALARVPHIGAYRVRWWEAAIARLMVKVNMVLLPNILLNERVVPELLQENCTSEKIAAAAIPLFERNTARNQQLDAFTRLEAVLSTPDLPSRQAAGFIIDMLRNRTHAKEH